MYKSTLLLSADALKAALQKLTPFFCGNHHVLVQLHANAHTTPVIVQIIEQVGQGVLSATTL